MLNQLIHNKAEQKRKDKKGWQALVILIEATGTQSQWTCTYECELVPCEGSGRCGQYGATPIIFGTVREKINTSCCCLKTFIWLITRVPHKLTKLGDTSIGLQCCSQGTVIGSTQSRGASCTKCGCTPKSLAMHCKVHEEQMHCEVLAAWHLHCKVHEVTQNVFKK